MGGFLKFRNYLFEEQRRIENKSSNNYTVCHPNIPFSPPYMCSGHNVKQFVVLGQAKIIEVLPFGNSSEIEMGQAKGELLEMEVVEEIGVQLHLATIIGC